MVAKKPKSPIDDVAKWLIKNGIKMTGSEAKKIKKFARGIGYNKEFEKTIAPRVEKKVASGKVPKKVGQHLERMSEKRQDKEARVFGDYATPHDYFGIGGRTGNKSTQRDLNKMFNRAWSDEMAIGRANAKKAAKAAKPARYAAPKPTKKQIAARKAAKDKAVAARKVTQKAPKKK